MNSEMTMDFIRDVFSFILTLVDTAFSGAIAVFLLVLIFSVAWWFFSSFFYNTKQHAINVAGFGSIFIIGFGFPILIASRFPLPDTPLVAVPLWISGWVLGYYVSKMIFMLEKDEADN